MDTREELITSARELFWERGYSATSPQLILKRAGVGQGSMYHHFSGKGDLAAVALERNSAENRQGVRELLDAAPSPLEAVFRYLESERIPLKGCNLGRMTQDPDVLADPRMRAPISETLNWYQEQLVELLIAAQESQELRADAHPESVAAAIVAIVQGAYVLARADQDDDAYHRAIAGGVQMLSALSTSGAEPGALRRAQER